MNATKFGAQELGIGTISPKMVEPQLEGGKVVDLNHHNLGEVLPLLLPSIYLFFSNEGCTDFSSLLMMAVGWR